MKVKLQHLKKKNKHDNDLVIKLLKRCIGEDFEVDKITKMFRIGRKSEDATKVRPVLVQFANMTTKNSLMANLNRLKNNAIKRMNISHDMTTL